MSRWLTTLLLLVLCPAVRALEVDLSPDFERKDVLSPHMQNWRVAEGETATETFDGVTITLRALGAEPVLSTDWWKAGLDYPATMASDGVIVRGEGAAIQIILRGLPAGPHHLATYHNILWDQPSANYMIEVNDLPAGDTITPSQRVLHDADAAATYVAFDVVANEDVVITIRPAQPSADARVILNGFELNTADPRLRARKPNPANGDEHAPEDLTFSWAASDKATAHHVYLGTDAAAVAAATPQSPEYQGAVETSAYQPQGLNHYDTYYWRVDTVIDGLDQPIKGQVWRFRVRHLAFPGAEGYGRFARGGRGGRVIQVTNLNDSGPGSLREAIEAEGPRTVVFRVGGTIELKSPLVIRNPYITIAGQTAPGDGIALANYTFGTYGTHDVIVRFIRVRVGDSAGRTMDGMGLASSDHVIFDHCSVAWSIDEALSSRGAGNITVQRCIIGEALNIAGHAKYAQGKGHSYAASISGNIGSFHHNLVAHCAGRNFSLAGGLTKGGKFAGYLDIRNNVFYNWHHRTTDGGVRLANIVNNYFIPGPASRVDHIMIAKMELKLPDDVQQYYVAGNVMEGRPHYNPDNWANGGVRFEPEYVDQMRLDEPFCEPFVTTHSAEQAYQSVIADVGANFPRLDEVDQRILKDVINRSFTARGSISDLPGIIDSQEDVGGYPKLRGGHPPSDRDGDGMPDHWEAAFGLDPDDPEDRNGDFNGDGYTNLEKYLNWIVETRRQ